MIRINLLGLKKEVKKSAMAMPAISMQGTMLIVAAVAFILLGFGWVGYRYWSLDKQTTQIADDTAKATKESKDLADVKVAVEKLEVTKKQLAKQVEVIEALEKGRTGPMDMLYALSNTVVGTKTMWLTTFENTGNKISIKGEATSMPTVADFMENLRKTGYFTNIEIKETSQDEAYKDIQAFVFEMSADVIQPGQAAATTAQGKVN